MEKYYSKVIGAPVHLEHGGRPLSHIDDLLIDSTNGKIAVFSLDSRYHRVIAPIDVVDFNDGITIQSPDDIVDIEDLLQAQQIAARNIPIIGNKVVNQEGEYLGKVYDYAIDTSHLVLTKICFAKNILGILRVNQRILPFKAIYEVMRDKIIVKTDNEVIEEEPKKALNLETA